MSSTTCRAWRSYPGLPDLQAVKGGRTIYIEIKRPGGRQSAKQKKFQQDLEAAGGVYILAFSIKEVRELYGFLFALQ